MERRYRIFIDESGDHVFNEKNLHRPEHRYLALLGSIFQTDNWRAFEKRLDEFKQKHFANAGKPVILHRSDIINRRGPFWRLRDADRRRAFEEDLLELLTGATYGIVLVVVDKLAQSRAYEDVWHPYHLALGFLLQRYCGYLNHFNSCGDLMAESRGRRENELLSNAYEHVYVHGDRFHRAGWYQRSLTSKKLKLKPKEANVAGLQLSDMLAHPLKQRFLAERERSSERKSAFGPRLADAVEDKYNRHLGTGEIDGWGRVLFPK